jgi:hypothetical protein
MRPGMTVAPLASLTCFPLTLISTPLLGVLPRRAAAPGAYRHSTISLKLVYSAFVYR